MYNLNELKKIIDTGLLLEDRIVKIYSNALKHGSMVESLSNFDKKKINMLLETLITDTVKHQEYLHTIKHNIYNNGK